MTFAEMNSEWDMHIQVCCLKNNMSWFECFLLISASEAAATSSADPSESTDAPSESTDAPSESTDAPSESTDAPSQSTDAPTTGSAASTSTAASSKSTASITTRHCKITPYVLYSWISWISCVHYSQHRLYLGGRKSHEKSSVLFSVFSKSLWFYKSSQETTSEESKILSLLFTNFICMALEIFEINR